MATQANGCFGCGASNPRGMQLVFERDSAQQRVRGRFQLGGEYQGGPGFIHGGIIAVVLDEAMGKVCRFSDVRAVTAELSIEYKKPIRVDEEFIVEAFQESRDGRVFFIVGEIRRVSGQLLARGTGRFVAVDPLTFTV